MRAPAFARGVLNLAWPHPILPHVLCIGALREEGADLCFVSGRGAKPTKITLAAAVMESNMRMSSILVIASILLIGCESDSVATLPDPQWVSVSSIKSIAVTNRTASFTVVCVVSESCWRFARTEHSVSGQSYTIGVFAQRTANGPCARVLTSIEAPAVFTVPSAGNYTFRFMQLESTIDTTISFP
jgi:hypothetical protein